MRRDDILLLDMLVAARRAMEFLDGVAEEEFEKEPMRHLAVMKAIEVIGEAAGRLTEAFRSAHPEFPWSEIIGMRHRLVHGYFEVNLRKVWDTVHEEFPELIAMLEPLIAPEED